MSDNLKPCPFCGGKGAVFFVDDDYGGYSEVGCTQCSATASPRDWRKSPDDFATALVKFLMESGEDMFVRFERDYNDGVTMIMPGDHCHCDDYSEGGAKVENVVQRMREALKEYMARLDHIRDTTKKVEGESK